MVEQLTEILKRAFPDMNTDNITRESRLIEDLGFDSMALIMLSMELEETFDFRFKEFVKFETAGDVCDYLEQNIVK